MKSILFSLVAVGGATAMSLTPLSAAYTQMETAPVAAPAPAAAEHGDWTLRQREDWLSERLKRSLDNGAVDKAEFNRARLEMDHLRQEESRMRHDGKGELTDNQTIDLKARLDTMSDKIHWANMSDYKRPW